MPKISLTQFADFSIASGPPRVTRVRTIRKQQDAGHHPKKDFWRLLREGIIECSRDGRAPGALRAILPTLRDKKKIDRYPAAIDGFLRWRARKQCEWFDPPHVGWERGTLTVRVNPGLGLASAQATRVIKLYFKRTPELSRQRVQAILRLMDVTLPAKIQGRSVEYAILDVCQGKLFVAPRGGMDLDLLMGSDAAAFLQIWDHLR